MVHMGKSELPYPTGCGRISFFEALTVRTPEVLEARGAAAA